MANEIADDMLRELAQHRGLKLVKSRRRKPGVGDYGKFGLKDGAGKPLLGVGDDGLTANAMDIEAYLRAGAAGTWRQSADLPMDRPAAKKGAPPKSDVDAPARGKPSTGGRNEATEPPERADRKRPASSRKEPVQSASAPPPQTEPKPNPKPEPVPEPELTIRTAKPGDAEALARLLSQLTQITIDTGSVADNLTLVRKAGGGTILAERGTVIGCCAWALVTTLHRGLIGRITTLIVAEKERREGLGTQLLDAALAELVKAKCHAVEAMSDIDLKNSHNFFRTTGFDQTSYRFARKLD